MDRCALTVSVLLAFSVGAYASGTVSETDSVVAQCAVGYEPIVQDMDATGKISDLNSGGFTNGEYICTSGQGGRVGVYRSTVSRYNRCTAVCPVSAPLGRFLSYQEVTTNGNCRVACRKLGTDYDVMRCYNNGVSTSCAFYENYSTTCCTGEHRGGIAHLLGGSSRVEGCTITGGGYLKADSTFPFYSCFSDNSCKLTSVCNIVTGGVSSAVSAAIGKYTE